MSRRRLDVRAGAGVEHIVEGMNQASWVMAEAMFRMTDARPLGFSADRCTGAFRLRSSSANDGTQEIQNMAGFRVRPL